MLFRSVEVYQGREKVLNSLQDYSRMKGYSISQGDDAAVLPVNTTVCGDITLVISHARQALGSLKPLKICQVQLHTSSLTPGRPSYSWELQELDSLAEPPMELLTQALDLCGVTSLEQRMAQLEAQPQDIASIFPRHKHLMIKRSQRCRRCEHNLSKPEYNPTSIKFKIQLAAYYHVPEIVIYRVGSLQAGLPAKFVIKVVNPSNTGTELELVSLAALQSLKDQEEASRAEARARGEEREDRPVSAINPLRQPSIVEAEDRSLGLVTAQVAMPASKVYLPPRDDAAEFDDGGVDMAGHTDEIGRAHV